MHIRPTSIPGCFEIIPNILTDHRGSFVKTFNSDLFIANGLDTHFVEEYYSRSRRRVLRGMHFQSPPMQHTKLVYCIEGSVTDVVIDLRRGSPSYGHCVSFDLNSKSANMVYIPAGLAHGFYVNSEHALMMYKVTSVYSPQNDTGILWNSIGYRWTDSNPIISIRDKSFCHLDEYDSSFVYTEPSD